MKKTIKTFVDRLHDAWAIIRGCNHVFIRYEEKQRLAIVQCVYSQRVDKGGCEAQDARKQTRRTRQRRMVERLGNLR